MLFSSNIFLFLFLPFVIVVYYLLHKSYRNAFLCIASLLFYAWGEPKFVYIMIGSIIFNYVMALAIDRTRIKAMLCKLFFVTAIAGNLGLLFVCKYLDFFIENMNLLGFDVPLQKIALPIGISFFTFQAMSYVIDVYRQTATVQRKPQHIGLFISFFPQLIAGPIVRYQTIADQINERKETFDAFNEGVKRFIIGLSKKIIIANNMALIADKAFGLPDVERSVLYAWIGVIAYSFQVLFDFSGYSDMAVGLGKMFGFHFLENFNYPYISKSVSEFWRRWHISLGQWFRDYVYFPLGGSRVKTWQRLVFNLFVVWLLTGVWHGASWNFILWGLFYFVLLAFEKISGYPEKFQHHYKKSLYRVFTLLCVMGGWVLFRALNIKAALRYGLSMLGLQHNPLFCDHVLVALREYWFFFLAGILCATPLLKWAGQKINASGTKALQMTASAATVGAYVFLFLWSVSYIVLGSHNPFIYFNF